MGCTVVKRSDLGRPGQVRPRQPHTYPLGRRSHDQPHQTPTSHAVKHAPLTAPPSSAVAAIDLHGWRCSIVVLAEFHEGHVVVAVALAAAPARSATAAERLGAAVGRLRCAMAFTQADTHGGRSRLPAAAWDELVRLGRPVIRQAVRSCRVPRDRFDDCVQEAWLDVTAGIHRVDPNPARGNLVCWLHTVARRAATRFLRREALAAAGVPLPARPPDFADPRQPDPAEAYAAREALGELAALVDSLRASMGEDAYRVVVRFLAADRPSLNSLPGELGLTRGHLFHHWRKAITRLREKLLSEDA